MKTIGVISDTHGLLRDEALSLLRGVDHIIHAGDLGDPQIIARLEDVAPVSAVRGNIDVQPWAGALPDTLVMDLFGRKIFVIHDLNDIEFDPARKGIDLVISGHSHKPKVVTYDGVLYLNPGSAGRRRFNLPITLSKIEVGKMLMPTLLTIA